MDAKRKQANRIIQERRKTGWYAREHLDLPNMSDEQVYRFMAKVQFVWNEKARCWMYQHGLFDEDKRPRV